MMGKHTTDRGDSSVQYSIIHKKPQSSGVTQTRQKNLLSMQWNQTSQPTPPFSPATKKQQQQQLVHPMSMSTFGFIAHSLRPSTPQQDNQNNELPKEAPQAVTGISFSLLTTKN